MPRKPRTPEQRARDRANKKLRKLKPGASRYSKPFLTQAERKAKGDVVTLDVATLDKLNQGVRGKADVGMIAGIAAQFGETQREVASWFSPVPQLRRVLVQPEKVEIEEYDDLEELPLLGSKRWQGYEDQELLAVALRATNKELNQGVRQRGYFLPKKTTKDEYREYLAELGRQEVEAIVNEARPEQPEYRWVRRQRRIVHQAIYRDEPIVMLDPSRYAGKVLSYDGKTPSTVGLQEKTMIELALSLLGQVSQTPAKGSDERVYKTKKFSSLADAMTYLDSMRKGGRAEDPYLNEHWKSIKLVRRPGSSELQEKQRQEEINRRLDSEDYQEKQTRQDTGKYSWESGGVEGRDVDSGDYDSVEYDDDQGESDEGDSLDEAYGAWDDDPYYDDGDYYFEVTYDHDYEE